MRPKMINAVFEGGGVKGISLVGAVRAVELRGIQFNHLAGTSSGSMVASLLAAGYCAEELKMMILNTPFSSFLRKSVLHRIKYFGPAIRLFIKKGIYSGEALELWMRRMLEMKGVRTFGDLQNRKLQIIASDITNHKLLVLPDDITQYGIDPNRLEVAKAVRMSTSIPYFFDPVIVRRRRSETDLFQPFAKQFDYIVDGGLLSNFPLWLFDADRTEDERIPTVGFQMIGRNEGSPHPIRGPISMLHALFETMLSAHDERHIEKYNLFRTIKIPTLGVRTTQFDIKPEMSLKLYNAGLEAAHSFFEKWDATTYDYQLGKYRGTDFKIS